MELHVICRQTFIYFYEKIYKKACPIDISSSEKSLAAYCGFVERITLEYGESIGADYIWTYTLFQFGRYIEKIKSGTVGLNGKMTPLTVFGKKPHEVYKNRRVEMDWITETGAIRTEYKVSKAEFSYVKGVKFTTQQSKVARPYNNDPIKRIAAAGEDPITTCRDMTDLFNEKDKACKHCPAAVECKELLKRLYPKIYKERNYE